ncbi:MAG: hypothetical protein SCH71_15900 [Desulfobulbaceae bacterium]|nr:hypothetical protein [Desulfobulbaceae bacterium]
MGGKKKTACKDYPGRFLASGSTSQNHITSLQHISQVRRLFRFKAITIITRLALWGLLPITWAEKLLEGLHRD